MARVRLFGRVVETDVAFSTPLVETDAPADLHYRLVTAPRSWDEPGPVVHTEPPFVDGEPFATLHRVDERTHLVRFTRVVDFVLGPNAIEGRLHDPQLDWLAELRLLGPAMALWLELRGEVALHASSVGRDGRAIGFMSVNGGGKTTLAAAFLADGHALLSDDVTAIRVGNGDADARPSYPQLRLWPADVTALTGLDPQHLPRAHPHYEKRRLRVGDGGYGSHETRSQPLGALYVLDRQPGAVLEVQRLRGGEPVRELLGHSFVGRYLGDPRFAVERTARLARLCAAVPVSRVTHDLPAAELKRHIERDLEAPLR